MFYILKNMRLVGVDAERWSEWHGALNRHTTVGNKYRVLDEHHLKRGDDTAEIVTIFQGMQGQPPWLTFIRNTSFAEFSDTIGTAMETHHSLVRDLLESNYVLDPEYDPMSYINGDNNDRPDTGDARPDV